MDATSHILAIDQGTTSTRAVVFDDQARPRGSAQVELPQIYPRPGWVEHDPERIFADTLAVVRGALGDAGLAIGDVAAIGITNQRETTVLWERATGRPVSNAIVWQCRRTAQLCEQLTAAGHAEEIRQRTGLVVDPYFSGTKLRWLLDNTPDGQRRAEAGELCFGTIDSWLMSRLSGGSAHVTDVTNAGRTMLFNIHDLAWDEGLLALLDIPAAVLPTVLPSAAEFAVTSPAALGAEVPVTGVAGDQHAALYGQACFRAGQAKCTYGTGAFVLMNAGPEVPAPVHGLLTTPAWRTGAVTVYALEGSVFSTGATVQWLRDGLGLLGDAAESEALARSVPDNGGVYLVPAFVGLGAPYWDPAARGTIVGLTRDSGAAHFARAALESTAYQVRDVLEAMPATGDTVAVAGALRVDGGQTANRFLMEFQAGILGRPLEVAPIQGTTALGAAFLAGRGAGLWDDESALSGLWTPGATYEPRMSADEADTLYARWRAAVRQARGQECVRRLS